MQQRAADGDRSGVDKLQVQQGTAASLSLKARETASLSLKRIYEQQIEAASRSNTAAPQHISLHGGDDDQQHAGCVLSTAAHLINSHQQLLQDQAHDASEGIDLELRLAAPFTSASHTAEDEAVQIKHPQNVSVNDVGKAQLTILYAGKLYVYEDVPADQVRAVMLLVAESGDRSRAIYRNAAGNSRPVTPASSSDMLCRPAKLVRRSQADLPLARKASLARFFEKRKERVETKSAHSDEAAENGKLPATSDDESQPPQKRNCP